MLKPGCCPCSWRPSTASRGGEEHGGGVHQRAWYCPLLRLGAAVVQVCAGEQREERQRGTGMRRGRE